MKKVVRWAYYTRGKAYKSRGDYDDALQWQDHCTNVYIIMLWPGKLYIYTTSIYNANPDRAYIIVDQLFIDINSSMQNLFI